MRTRNYRCVKCMELHRLPTKRMHKCPSCGAASMVNEAKRLKTGKYAKRASTETNYLYIMGCPGFIKIGISRNPRKRMTGIQCGNPHKIVPVELYDAGTCQKVALRIESMVHSRLRIHRAEGEWFAESCLETAREFIKNIPLKSVILKN